MDTKTPLVGGLVLGGLVVVWQIAAAALGLSAVFPLVATLIELVVLIAVLMQTREQAYLQQLGSGSLATVVSLVPIVGGFFLTVFVLFPDQVPEDQVVAQGMGGVIGTLVTGIFVSAIAAIFLRKRE